MPSLFDNVNPSTPAETAASRTEIELRAKLSEVAVLEQRLASEQALLAESTPAQRTAAVALHGAMCPHDHAIGACSWYASPAGDDAAFADWAEVAHQRWLKVVQGSVLLFRAQGWTVTEP